MRIVFVIKIKPECPRTSETSILKELFFIAKGLSITLKLNFIKKWMRFQSIAERQGKRRLEVRFSFLTDSGRTNMREITYPFQSATKVFTGKL